MVFLRCLNCSSVGASSSGITDALRSSNIGTRCFCRYALQISTGFRPSRVRILRSDPWFRRYLTISTCPNAQAKCSADQKTLAVCMRLMVIMDSSLVCLLMYLSPISRVSTRNSTTFKCPLCEATCRRVSSPFLVTLRSAPKEKVFHMCQYYPIKKCNMTKKKRM